jgi:hypothetical protein
MNPRTQYLEDNLQHHYRALVRLMEQQQELMGSQMGPLREPG